jgi:hypothetical protein
MANNNPVNVYPDPDGSSNMTQPVEEPVPNPASSPDSYGVATNDAASSASPAAPINY